MQHNIKNLALLKDNSNNLITGAGVMLLHYYNGKPSIIIVHNKHSDKWDIPGGGIDTTDISPQYTASKELKEETACLFNIDMKVLESAEYCDISSKTGMIYRCYILFIEADIHRKYYYDNMKILNKYNIPHCYKETNKLNRLKLDDFNHNNIIRERDATIIKKSTHIIEKVLKTVPIKLKYSDNMKISEFPNITNLKSYYI